MCPLITIRVCEQLPLFTEAAILVFTSGHFTGEYVAVCAKKRCGYFGKHSKTLLWPICGDKSLHTVHIERLYDKLGVRVKVYPPRGLYLVIIRVAE
jgi:hypothetical protein